MYVIVGLHPDAQVIIKKTGRKIKAGKRSGEYRLEQALPVYGYRWKKAFWDH